MSSQTSTTTNNPWVNKPNPWGKSNQENVTVPCSLEEVMNEQLAQELDTGLAYLQPLESSYCIGGAESTLSDAELAAKLAAEEEEAIGATFASNTLCSDAELAAKLAAEDGGDLSTDELIARCMQRDLDREYNSEVDMLEKSYNGTSKVSISFSNYKQRDQPAEQYSDSDEDDNSFPEFPTQTSWDSPNPVIGAKGYSGQGKNIITKHDKTICGRRNAERLMEFPPEFDSGDGEGMNMRLPNKVYNHLKAHSKSENKKGHRVHDKKDQSTAIKAVDERTRILMFKMVNSGYLASIEGVINEGKEAMVFKAIGGMKEDEEMPKDVILKVYKTSMNEFKTRAKYVHGDHRLSKDAFKKQNPRKIMKIWAEKEYLNLKRMRRHNLPCPSVLTLKKHVLAMTCIGGENPAPKLKDVKLSSEQMADAYSQTVDIMKRMYTDCDLVHADMSEYNLLWHDETVWVIDVSQSREKVNANSNMFLFRDCQNVCNFFQNAGVPGVRTTEELFMEITNYSFEGTGKVFESQVERYVKEDYSFDFYFELAESARLQDLNDKNSSSGSEEDAGEEAEAQEETTMRPEKEGKSNKDSGDKCLLADTGKSVIDSS